MITRAMRAATGGTMVAAAMTLLTGSAAAQPALLKGRFAIHVDGGYQATSEEFTQSLRQRVYGEEARLETTGTVGTGAFADVGGFVTVWESVGVGATYTHISKSGTARLSGSVPHPVAFGSDRPVSAQIEDLRHRERATHLHVSWRLPFDLLPKLDLTAYGGPSFFNVTQGIPIGVVIRETGTPFTSVTVDQVVQDEHTRNGWGAHVGLDVTYMWTTYVGAGGLVRYAAGSVDMPGGDPAVFSLRVGGFQAGGGLRVRF